MLREFLDKWYDDGEFRTDVARFVLTVAFGGILLALVVQTKPEFPVLQEIVAYQTSGILTSVGIQSNVEGDHIITPVLKVEIIPVCTGWLGVATLAVLVLTVPRVPWRKRIEGIVVGAIFIHAFNIARLVISIWMANLYGIRVFDAMHMIFFRAVMVGFALMIWFYWYRKR
jgi:exosortase/archaeosortase family protein